MLLKKQLLKSIITPLHGIYLQIQYFFRFIQIFHISLLF